jgi:hypothetical protein
MRSQEDVTKKIYTRRLLETENEFEGKLLVVVAARDWRGGGGTNIISHCGESPDEEGGGKGCSCRNVLVRAKAKQPVQKFNNNALEVKIQWFILICGFLPKI